MPLAGVWLVKTRLLQSFVLLNVPCFADFVPGQETNVESLIFLIPDF